MQNARLFQVFRYFRPYSTDLLRTDTKVSKDVILFKFENPKYFKYLNLFGVAQFGFWSYMASFAYTELKDIPVKEKNSELPWWRNINFGDPKYKYGLTCFSLLFGYGTLASAWSYTLKSVRFLILRKGGQKLSIVTYTPFGKNRIMDVPLNNVSAKSSRTNSKVQLPIKVKGKSLHYILDMRGEFLNKGLFDATAGIYRKL